MCQKLLMMAELWPMGNQKIGSVAVYFFLGPPAIFVLGVGDKQGAILSIYTICFYVT